MLLTANDFQEIGKALTAAKKDPANCCKKLRPAPPGAEDLGDGTYEAWVPVSGVPQSADRRKRWQFRTDDEGNAEKKVVAALGEHGVDFLGIDPATKKVACAACKEGE